MKKATGDIILHKCTINYDQMMYDSWDMVCHGQRDRQMEGKSDIEVGAPPNKFCMKTIYNAYFKLEEKTTRYFKKEKNT